MKTRAEKREEKRENIRKKWIKREKIGNFDQKLSKMMKKHLKQQKND